MSVDNDLYRIITMESYDTIRGEREQVHLYDSTTSPWRKLRDVPRDRYCAYSSISMNGVLFALFVDLAAIPWLPVLIACALATSAWSYINVDLPRPSHPQEKSQLVVSSGCLCLVEFTGHPVDPDAGLMSTWESLLALESLKRKHLIKVSIWEILLAKEVVKVTQMSKYSRYSRYSRTMLQWPDEEMGEVVVAVGCADPIVISSLLGRRVAFNLSKKLWHELPAYSSEHKYTRKDGRRHGGICVGPCGHLKGVLFV